MYVDIVSIKSNFFCDKSFHFHSKILTYTVTKQILEQSLVAMEIKKTKEGLTKSVSISLGEMIICLEELMAV